MGAAAFRRAHMNVGFLRRRGATKAYKEGHEGTAKPARMSLTEAEIHRRQTVSSMPKVGRIHRPSVGVTFVTEWEEISLTELLRTEVRVTRRT